MKAQEHEDRQCPRMDDLCVELDDPNFWEKVLPFDGYNPKQLMRKFRSKKNEILEKDKRLAKHHKECLDVYNSIVDEKKSLKLDLDAINIKSKSLYTPR